MALSILKSSIRIFIYNGLSHHTPSINNSRYVLHQRCFASNTNKVVDVPKYRDEGSRVELNVPRWPKSVRYSYTWLRDHCRCSGCYNYVTQQRRLDVHSIPLDIVPMVMKTSNNALHIEWPDGHISEYAYKFLWQNSYEGQSKTKKLLQVPWKAHSFPNEDLISTKLSSLQKGSSGLSNLLTSIVQNGIGLITEVPPTLEATREAIEHVTEVKKTFFGDMWYFSAENMEHADTAYTNESLGAHTDTTYFAQAARIQVFHCLQAAEIGGDTLLVDGLSIAEQYKLKYPKGYEFLSKYAIPSHYLEEGQHHRSLDFVFKHHANSNRLKQFRYNIYDRAPLSSLPFEHVDEYYQHLQNLTKIVRMKTNEHWYSLTPGNVLFIDNWRVMHGRSGYKGSRKMSGCYLDEDDFSSKCRTLGINVD